MAYKRHTLTPEQVAAELGVHDPELAANIRAVCRPDLDAAWDRFGSNADLAQHWLEAVEFLLDHGRTTMVWDALADKIRWPPGLQEYDARLVARKVLAYEAEHPSVCPHCGTTFPGRDAARADALKLLLCGPARFTSEQKKPDVRRSIREMLTAQPLLSIEQISRKLKAQKLRASKSTISEIRTAWQQRSMSNTVR
jgi:hypothetical protein